MKKCTRFLVMLALTVAAIAPLTGCGVATTSTENRRVFDRVVSYDAKMLVDDLALLCQTNRPLRTSKFIID